MSDEDREALAYAKSLLENPSFAAKAASMLGTPVEAMLKFVPPAWRGVVNQATRKSLTLALDAALFTLDRKRRKRRKRPDAFLHKAAVALTGAAGGAFGLAGLPVELPVTTAVMLRSIADIGRAEGESFDSPGSRLACLEVFALGGRSARDDAADSAYFAVRGALAKSVSEAAKYIAERGIAEEGAPAIVRLVAQIASRFGVNVSEKLAAQSVPLLGAAGGATINVLFIAHYQDMARGHFIIRRLERVYGPETVRTRYDAD